MRQQQGAGGGNAGAHAATAARTCATDGAAIGSGGGAETGVDDEGALCAVTEDVDGGDVAVDTAVGVAAPAVADGDMTRSAGAISSKKRRRSRGPAQAARHAAFLASREHDATDGTQAQMGMDARGKGGGGRMAVSWTTLPR